MYPWPPLLAPCFADRRHLKNFEQFESALGRGCTKSHRIQASAYRDAQLGSGRPVTRSANTAGGGGADPASRRGVPRVTGAGPRTQQQQNLRARGWRRGRRPALLPPAAASARGVSWRAGPRPSANFSDCYPLRLARPGVGRAGRRGAARRERPPPRTPAQTVLLAALLGAEGGGGGPRCRVSVRSQAEPGPGGESCTHGRAPRPRRHHRHHRLCPSLVLAMAFVSPDALVTELNTEY
ncbi:uncharacterized protein [Marmota flaviventris]|uniref:uncharacterized protein n=1 Tax=Marmota flaviventris TaxID=93162 RepID=UPI003A8396DD